MTNRALLTIKKVEQAIRVFRAATRRSERERFGNRLWISERRNFFPFRPASSRTAQAGRLCYPNPVRKSGRQKMKSRVTRFGFRHCIIPSSLVISHSPFSQSFIPKTGPPNGAVVKGSRNGQQTLTNPIKAKPCDENSRKK